MISIVSTSQKIISKSQEHKASMQRWFSLLPRAEGARETRGLIDKLEECVKSRRVVVSAVIQVMSSHELNEALDAALRDGACKSIEQFGAEIVASGHFQVHAKRTARLRTSAA